MAEQILKSRISLRVWDHIIYISYSKYITGVFATFGQKFINLLNLFLGNGSRLRGFMFGPESYIDVHEIFLYVY